MPDRETGFCFQYSVEKTEDKGLGVFAREPIKKGSVVWRHVPGIFVVYDEHSFRAKIEKMPPADVVYELTHVHGLEDFPGCLIRAFDDGVLINHSRNPTLVTNNAAPASTSFDVNSRRYLHEVTEALLDDRYSLVATRDIESGEEFINDYSAEDACPPYYDVLYEQYGVCEDFLDDRAPSLTARDLRRPIPAPALVNRSILAETRASDSLLQRAGIHRWLRRLP